ncbi:MAG: PRC-barrel domain-containing protein [Methanomassiliicoccales archaeon]|nr:PRC-barrel domain-containing protein [Methanomassiliicoccales archaeon]
MSGLEDIVGKEVISADAKIIGKVEGITVDSDTWKVPAIRVIVRKGNEAALNIKKKAIGTQKVHVATPQVSSVTDTVTLAVKMEQVKDVLIEDKKVPLNADKMINKKVVAQDGTQVGYLDNVYFERSKNWEVTKIGIKLDKTAKQTLFIKGGATPSAQITLMTKDVRSVGDMIMLRLDMESIKDYLNKKQVSRK